MPSRPTLPPHSGTVINRKTFSIAYKMIQEQPDNIYTTAFGTQFTAEARLTQKGIHPGQKVIIFKQDGKRWQGRMNAVGVIKQIAIELILILIHQIYEKPQGQACGCAFKRILISCKQKEIIICVRF